MKRLVTTISLILGHRAVTLINRCAESFIRRFVLKCLKVGAMPSISGTRQQYWNSNALCYWDVPLKALVGLHCVRKIIMHSLHTQRTSRPRMWHRH